MLCALVASLAVAVSAAAEEGDAAPIRSINNGGFTWPEITSVAGFEEYPFEMGLGPGQRMEQVGEREIVVKNEGGTRAFSITAPLAHDAEGANVPTSLVLSAPEVVTIIVHHRAGNPLTGAPFVYPIIAGAGWAGGFHTISVSLGEPPSSSPSPSPSPATPAPTQCTVPSLHGLSLRAAKTRLRAAHCSIGDVHLGPGATEAKGKVVKQFQPAGTDLAAGAAVAVKLAPRSDGG